MNDEFYIEETNPKKALLSIIMFIIVGVICVGGFIVYKQKHTLSVKNNIRLELGSKLETDINFYLKNKMTSEDDYDIDLSKIKTENGILTEVGEYTVTVKYKNIRKTGKVIVEDTTKPVVEVKDLVVGVNEDYDISDFVTKCEDLSKPCEVYYEKDQSSELQKNAGSYKFNIIINDAYKNSVVKTVNLVVKENYNSSEEKEKDLVYDHIDSDYKDYNNKMFLKFKKAINPDLIESNEEFQDMSSSDFSNYLSAEDSGNSIVSSEILYVYNKYNYVIGCAIRVKLSNGEYRYLTK